VTDQDQQGEFRRVPTKDGLAAAGEELDREAEGRGGMPKKAGCSGASHAMTVNEPVLTLLRPKSHLALLPGEPPEALAAVRARLDAQAGWAPWQNLTQRRPPK
jgi:hypothetical protein